jgi:hypothetical protein
LSIDPACSCRVFLKSWILMPGDSPQDRKIQHLLTKLIQFVVVDGDTYVNFFPRVALRTDSRFWPPLTGLRENIQLDTPHSIGLLWTRDQPGAETSTWQYTTIKRDRLSCPGRDSNPHSQQVIDICQYYRHVVHWPSIVCTVCNEGVNC